MKKTVTYCAEESIGAKLGINPGDEIISINGMTDFDIIDYFCAQAEDIISMEYRKNGDTAVNKKSIKNDEYLPIGLSFEHSTIDKPRHCANKCIFCFMDQMPGGVRDTLIFKDDDYRLSFTDGNYITLTNVSDEELQRICELKLSPMNISVHTTNPQLREKMLNNKKAGKIIDQLKILSDGGIDFNLQLVLCPGYNDGDELRRTLSDLLDFVPNIISLSAVPVGLTKYREGLAELNSFTKENAGQVIDIINDFREKAEEICGFGVFCASDEFYILAGRDFPEGDYYGDYTQYENGVGMYVSFFEDMEYALAEVDYIGKINAAVITGELGEKALKNMAEMLREKDPDVNLSVITVKNEYFGGKVTASGLVCGCDIINTLASVKDEYSHYIMPSNMLNDEMLTIDNYTMEQLREITGRNIISSPFWAEGFLETLLMIGGNNE